MKPSAPEPGLIEWLWSFEGLLWHQKNIRRVHHAAGAFGEIKKDHECDTTAATGPSCCWAGAYSPYADEFIKKELEDYGISGVPEEWKKRFRR